MRTANYVFTIIGLVIALIWLFKSGYEYEPMLAVFGYVCTFIGFFVTGKPENTLVLESDVRLLKKQKAINFFYFLVIVALIAFCLIRLNNSTVTGIKGSNNDNNTIIIK